MAADSPNMLIVYATREGQTAKIAGRLAEHLRGAGASVTLINARDPLPAVASGFDVVAYGGSMHAGGVERELIRFIARHHDALKPRFSAFFLVLLSAAHRDPEAREAALADAAAKLSAQIATPFDHVEMVAGALPYSKYSWPVRWVMKRIAKTAGGDTDTSRDYEYTDWDQVECFAERLLVAARIG